MHRFEASSIVAVLVAALTAFAIGGLWYGPLWRAPWMKHSGVTFGTQKATNPVVVFGLTYLLNVAVATGLLTLLGPHRTWLLGAHMGLFAGIAFVATALGNIYLFEWRPKQLWLINAGYQVLNFTAMGAVLGAWH